MRRMVIFDVDSLRLIRDPLWNYVTSERPQSLLVRHRDEFSGGTTVNDETGPMGKLKHFETDSQLHHDILVDPAV